MAQTILIIRHAEKPRPGDTGVNATGTPDAKSLTPRGWQRAGMWTEIFAPSMGQSSALPKPTAIFASAPERAPGRPEGTKSRRPLETVAFLAAKLGISLDLHFTKGKEAALARALSSVHGTALVCWQHEYIVAIAKALAPDVRSIPSNWPSNRFNVVFRLERTSITSSWRFEQVVPLMFADDESEPI